MASPQRVATTARTEHVSLLGGAITATAIKAVSISTHDGSGYHTSSAGSTFVGLKVLGVPISANPAPNTKISLPGVGRIVLNEQKSTITSNGAKLNVNAIHIFVTVANPLSIPVQTNVIVSSAFSNLHAPTGGFLRGFAYGSQAHVGTLLGAGPSFPVTMPCFGTGGHLAINTGAAVLLPGVVTTGTIRDTAQGTTTSTGATGETTSTINGTNLLNGLVKATLIKADAHATRANGTTTLSSAGSSFGSIMVNGKTLIAANIKSNTVIHIAGVGTLYLHRTIVTGNVVEVRMIDLVLSHAVLGLPTGTELRVAVANVGAF